MDGGFAVSGVAVSFNNRAGGVGKRADAVLAIAVIICAAAKCALKWNIGCRFLVEQNRFVNVTGIDEVNVWIGCGCSTVVFCDQLLTRINVNIAIDKDSAAKCIIFKRNIRNGISVRVDRLHSIVEIVIVSVSICVRGEISFYVVNEIRCVARFRDR